MLSSVWLFATLLTAAHQAPLPLGFSREEYWSRLSFPAPEGLLDPGIKPTSLGSSALQADSLPLSHLRTSLYAEYILQNARLDEVQAGIKTAKRNMNNLRYADDTSLMAKSEAELKSLLMRVKEESEKAGLKLNIPKTKIMASGPITSQQIDGEKMEQWQILFSWSPKSLKMVTTAMKLKDVCSLEEKLWET